MYLNSFHLFRGLAIILIVMGHVPANHHIGDSHFIVKMVFNMITSGTALFVFISGFLFHHLFYPHFNYPAFLVKKCKALLPPYVVLSFFPITLLIYYESPAFGGFFLPQASGVWAEWLKPYSLYLATGVVQFGYWYIPFIMVTFLLSPLHVLFIKLRAPIQFALFSLCLLMALLLHRPIALINIVQSVLYYTPVYLMGILCSLHKQSLYHFFYHKEYLLAMGVLLLSGLQTGVFDHIGGYFKPPLEWAGIDLMMLQKLLLCLLLMVFLHRFEHSKAPLLTLIANTSFAIFFLHGYIIFAFLSVYEDYGLFIGLSAFIVEPMVVIALCLALTLISKKLLKHKSRYIIGW